MGRSAVVGRSPRIANESCLVEVMLIRLKNMPRGVMLIRLKNLPRGVMLIRLKNLPRGGHVN